MINRFIYIETAGKATKIGIEFVGGNVGVIVWGGTNFEGLANFFTDSRVDGGDSVNHCLHKIVKFRVALVGLSQLGQTNTGELIERVIEIGAHGKWQEVAGNFLGALGGFRIDVLDPFLISFSGKSF